MKFLGSWGALILILLAPVFGISAAATNSKTEMTMKPAEVKKITVLLFAQELEPSIEFWTKKMGFQKTVEVPEGGKIGFAILVKDNMELMYQSFASVEKDNATTGAAARKGPGFLYIEVADIDATF